MWACVINRDGESKTYIIVATDKLPLRLEPDPQIRAVPELLTHAETAARVAGRRVFVFINAAHVAPTPRRHSGRPALAHAARRHTVLIAAKVGKARRMPLVHPGKLQIVQQIDHISRLVTPSTEDRRGGKEGVSTVRYRGCP